MYYASPDDSNPKVNLNNDEWRPSAPNEQEQFLPSKDYSQPAPNPYGPIPPIINQPGVIPVEGFNTPDRSISFYPPGLQHLASIDKLVFDQSFVGGGFNLTNTFHISNSLGEQIYYATEGSDCIRRNLFGPNRKFTVSVLDNFKNEVIHLHLPLNVNFCSWQLPSMEVSAPPGTVVGLVDQEVQFLNSSFALKNSNREVFLRIASPSFGCCEDVVCNIMSGDNTTVAGKLVKRNPGLALATMGHFEVTFPINLDVMMKAVLLGACILVDTLVFNRRR